MVLLVSLLVIQFPPIVAHPMPNSVMLLTVHADRIDADVQIPLVELQAAWGHAVNDSPTNLIARLGPSLRACLTRHIRPRSPDGRFWNVAIGSLSVHETQHAINGVYRELSAHVRLLPLSVRTSGTLPFDAVLHQVVTQKILVSVQQDWARGKGSDERPVQVGTVSLDIVNNQIVPLDVNLESGSNWAGFPIVCFGCSPSSLPLPSVIPSRGCLNWHRPTRAGYSSCWRVWPIWSHWQTRSTPPANA